MSRARRRLLAVDIGNTETLVGVFRGETIAGQWRLTTRERTRDELELLFEPLLSKSRTPPRGLASVVCSVVPALTERTAAALESLTGTDPLLIGRGKTPGLSIRYDDPASVGPDRLANAIAVRERYGKPAIVVDLGTATTFDVVGTRGEYAGGAIAPGVWTSSEELIRRAARLSQFDLVLPERAIGRSTPESLRAGILLGTAGMIDSLVARITEELGRTPRVIATGGLAAVIAPACESIEQVDEGLTLHGLRILFEQREERARRRKKAAKRKR